jgi:ABC-2 type transport system permease protein
MSKRRFAVGLFAVVRKEVRQTIRDRRVMFLLIAAPLLQTIALGFAIDFDFDDVPTSVVDQDRSLASRMHARRLLADGTLRRTLDEASTDVSQALAQLHDGEAAAALVFPENLQRNLLAGRPAEVQVLLDGTDPNRAVVVASAASQYFGQTGLTLLSQRLASAGMPRPPTTQAVPRVLYNPGLETSPFMIPGVMAMLLVITTTVVTAMGLSREREMGTLEQVLVTPIRPLFLLLGKMAPFFFIGCFDVFLVLTAGVWIFKVPVHGPLPVLAAATVFYLLCTLGIGLLISSISKTQQQSFLAGFLFVMPAILLSGVMTPIAAMPAWLRAFTYVNPVRYFVEILRANLLKGAGFRDLGWQLATLALLGVVIVLAATLRFHKRAG